MTLLDVVANLKKFDHEHTIFAVEPWSPSSSAIVAPEPENGSARGINGHAYFLEIFIAKECLEDWETVLTIGGAPMATCERLISYAINDA